MTNLKPFVDGNLNPEQQDAFLQSVLSNHYTDEYRNKWDEKLREQNVLRTPQKKTNYNMLLAVAAALAVVAIMFLLFVSQVNTSTPQHFADAYLTTEIYANQSVVKGGSDNNSEQTQDAITSFNRHEWKEAQTLYKSFLLENSQDLESRFYLGLSYFYDDQFEKAVEQFFILHSTSLDNDRRQEVNWFYGLSLYHNDQKEEAKKIWSEIKKGEWKYEEVR